MISQHRPDIIAAASTYRLDPLLVEAIVWQESSDRPDTLRYEPAFYTTYIRGNPKAKGYAFRNFAACSLGLMQILLETALEEGFTGAPEDLYQGPVGLDAGCKHFANLMTWAAGDHAQALGAYAAIVKGCDLKAVEAYNAGKGNYDSVLGQRYAAGVLHWKTLLT